MALSETVANIILDARRHADAETPTPTVDFTPDAELLRYLNNAYRKLIDMIIDAGGDAALSLLAKTTTVTSPYTLPADFYRLVGIDQPNVTGDGNTPWRKLKPFEFAQRNSYADPNFPRYRLVSGAIVLMPATAAPTSLQVWYLGNAGTLGSGDSINTFNGWDDFIAWSIARDILAKEDRDVSLAMAMIADARGRIEGACAELTAGDTHVIGEAEHQDEEYFDLRWP